MSRFFTKAIAIIILLSVVGGAFVYAYFPTDEKTAFDWDGGDVARGTEPPIDTIFGATPPTSAPMSARDNTARDIQGITTAEPVEEAVIIPADDDKNYATVHVNFATNRVSDWSAPIEEQFTGQVGELVYGQATVSIPRIHERGVLESQSWLMSFVAAPNPEKHVLVQELGIVPTQEALATISAQAGAGNNAVLVYVHGYNTSFDKAARRMGQMTYDLSWDGASFFYSWPSRAQAGLYLTDDTAAGQSVRVMKQVLADLGSLEGTPDLILIAHSMGTRVLSEALQQLVLEGDEVTNRISTLILAAPDIDKVVFVNDIAPRLAEMEQTAITLYASSEDSALKASHAARGFTRMGDSSEGLVLVDGIEIIDATGAESDFFGHTYFGDNVTIIDDIYDVVQGRLSASDRPLLTRRTHPDGIYWSIAQAE
jgi:esterase/lipase superfamily enzyme